MEIVNIRLRRLVPSYQVNNVFHYLLLGVTRGFVFVCM